MSDIKALLQDYGFTRTVIDSLPGGLIILDSQGRIMAVNNLVERIFDTSEHRVVGKGPGDALGCFNAIAQAEECGSGELCNACEIRNLALTCLASKCRQRARVNIQIGIDNQVRDVSLLLSAVPFDLDNERRFALLVIEDLTNLRSLSPPDTSEGFRGLLARSPQMLGIFKTIEAVSTTDAPVLIQGESGTGKELVSLAIHNESVRYRHHFVPVNCGALPEGVLESEIFGHVKGAFTGALRDRKGRFELAHKGTIFFDEVGELSHAVQVKLLRVLQDGSFERLGSDRPVRVNVRVISASNKILEDEVSAGRFREDLYYRLCVVPIHIPPLRERPEDIQLLLNHYLAIYAEEHWRPNVRLSSRAQALLFAYPWPGNVRELQNVLQYALVNCRKSEIEPEHLPIAIRLRTPVNPVVSHREPKITAEQVTSAIKTTKGNKKSAARLLGVSRSTLYRFLSRQK